MPHGRPKKHPSRHKVTHRHPRRLGTNHVTTKSDASRSKNPRSLKAQCKWPAKKFSAGHYTLKRIAEGKHPNHGCKVAVGKIVLLSECFQRTQLRELEDRLEKISRAEPRTGSLQKALAPPVPGEPQSSRGASRAESMYSALADRIWIKQAKDIAAAAPAQAASFVAPSASVEAPGH